MLVIDCNNVNEALPVAIMHLKVKGVVQASRYGDTIEYPEPVTTEYRFPMERVLFNEQRDANVVFNLFEALWTLGGRRDVSFLTQFNKRMTEFSDNGVDFHAGYGHRLRHAQGFDQINVALDMLTANPDSRRVVLQIWDAHLDLGADTKDIPCNDLIMCKIRNGALNISVANRSNDALLGCYNVNAVQFSMIQEYMADKLGVKVGTYHQVSDSLHVYSGDLWDKMKDLPITSATTDDLYTQGIVTAFPLGANDPRWDEDLHLFLNDPYSLIEYHTPFFAEVVQPLALAWKEHKSGQTLEAISWLTLENNDWHHAARNWFGRRL